LNATCKNIHHEIFVVDNNSTDGSEDFFSNRFENVTFIWNNENVGFAKANNSVLSQATGDCILFLNPDTIVSENCFEVCLEFFSTHKECGAVGVKMYDGNGVYLKESKRGFPDATSAFFKMIGLNRLFPNSAFFSKYYEGHLSENETNAVDVLPGAFMMLSRNALNAVHGFDEDYFMYGEDIDLSYRIVKAGYVNYYIAETSIIHFKGESTVKSSPVYTKNFYGAMKIFVNKHYANKKITKWLLLTAIAFSKGIADAKRVLVGGGVGN
jgi:GT2 family glycosyltransferase